MSYEKYIHFSTEDFIFDQYFMQWVLHPDQEKDLFWKEFLQRYPEKQEQVREASVVILAVRAVEPAISLERLEYVYQNSLLASKPVRKIGWMVAKIAAVFLLLVSIGGLLYYYLPDKNNTFPMAIATSELLEKGRGILPDGTITEFESEQTRLSFIH